MNDKLYNSDKNANGEIHMINEDDENKYTVLDILSSIVRNKLFIILTTIIAGIISIIFALYTKYVPYQSGLNPLPTIYKAKVTVLLTWEGIESRVSNLDTIPNVNPTMFIAAGIADPYIDFIRTILTANPLLDSLIEEFDLIKRYGYEDQKDSRLKTKNKLKNVLRISPMTNITVPLYSFFEISFIDPEPDFTAKLLERTVELLEDNFNDITMEQIVSKKIYIEERMQAVKSEIDLLKQELNAFREKYGAIDIETQAVEQTKLITELRADVIKRELEMEILLSYLKETDPKVIVLKNEISKREELIYDLENRNTSGFLPLNSVPEIAAEYIELKNNLEIKEGIYGTFKREYEETGIEEINSLNNFQIIEPVEIPIKSYAPKRTMMVFTVMILTFLFSIVIVLVREYFIFLSQKEKVSTKLKMIKSDLKRWKKKTK